MRRANTQRWHWQWIGAATLACSLASCDAPQSQTAESLPVPQSASSVDEAGAGPVAAAQLEASINSFMSRLHDSFPETYRAVMSEAQSDHATRAEAFAAGQAILAEFTNDHAEELTRAPPEALGVLAQRMSDAVESIRREDVGLCAQLFRTAPNPSDALALGERSKTLVALAAVARLDAIASARDSTLLHARLTESEWQELYVVTPMQSLEVFAADDYARFSHEQICNAHVDLWTAIGAAPSPIRARAVVDTLAR